MWAKQLALAAMWANLIKDDCSFNILQINLHVILNSHSTVIVELDDSNIIHWFALECKMNKNDIE